MAGIKTTEANGILDDYLSGTHYLALFTVAPTATTSGTEVTGGSYARVSFTFASASGGAKANASGISFPTATAGWGNIVAWAAMSASSGGTQKAFRAISSMPVNNGDQVEADAGNIIVTLG